MKDIIIGIAIIIVILFSIYCSYWFFKTISYTLFYESMVEDTIRDMIKNDSLCKP